MTKRRCLPRRQCRGSAAARVCACSTACRRIRSSAVASDSVASTLLGCQGVRRLRTDRSRRDGKRGICLRGGDIIESGECRMERLGIAGASCRPQWRAAASAPALCRRAVSAVLQCTPGLLYGVARFSVAAGNQQRVAALRIGQEADFSSSLPSATGAASVWAVMHPQAVTMADRWPMRVRSPGPAAVQAGGGMPRVLPCMTGAWLIIREASAGTATGALPLGGGLCASSTRGRGRSCSCMKRAASTGRPSR